MLISHNFIERVYVFKDSLDAYLFATLFDGVPGSFYYGDVRWGTSAII